VWHVAFDHDAFNLGAFNLGAFDIESRLDIAVAGDGVCAIDGAGA